MDFLFKVLVLFALVYIPSAYSCPPYCKCDANIHVVHCSDPNLYSFPLNIPTDTISLSVAGTYSRPLPLTSLSHDDLHQLINLRTLVISQTNIKTIQADAFKGLASLSAIDLTNNQLEKLDEHLFDDQKNLTLLYLSGNKNCDLPSNLLQSSASSLTELYLNGMGLKAIDTGLLSGLNKLSALDLSDNEIKELPTQQLASPGFLKSLKVLDLRMNQLTRLKKTLAPLVDHVPTIKLEDNPWICDCDLIWAKAYGNRLFPASAVTESVLCDGPAAVQFEIIVQLAPSRMICQPPQIVECLKVKPVLEEETFQINCTVLGEPFPDIAWQLADNSIVTGNSDTGKSQLNIQNSTVLITLKGGKSTNGTIVVNASNSIGVVVEKVDVFVKPLTTTTVTTTTITTTTLITTTTKKEISTEQSIQTVKPPANKPSETSTNPPKITAKLQVSESLSPNPSSLKDDKHGTTSPKIKDDYSSGPTNVPTDKDDHSTGPTVVAIVKDNRSTGPTVVAIVKDDHSMGPTSVATTKEDGGNLMIFIAAGAGGGALLIGAIIAVVACKKCGNSNMVEPSKVSQPRDSRPHRTEKNHRRNNFRDDEDDEDDYDMERNHRKSKMSRNDGGYNQRFQSYDNSHRSGWDI